MPDTDRWEYIPAKWQKTPTHKRDIFWIILLSMEAPESENRARACAKYFQNPSRPGSSHVCVDDHEIIQCVYDSNIAAGAVGANTHGLHIEQAGYAAQTAADWSDDYSKATILNAAEVAAQWCIKYNIPVVFLSAADLQANKKGISSHAQVSLAFPGSGHTDPGKDFPYDDFIVAVQAAVDKRRAVTSPDSLIDHGA